MNIKKFRIGLLFLILALVIVPGATAATGSHPLGMAPPSDAAGEAACVACHIKLNAQLSDGSGPVTCGSCHADPYPPAPVLTTISVTPSPVTVVQGNTQTFTASPKDQFGKPIVASIVWSSRNTTVGAISASGVLTAVSAGTTAVTATSGSVKGTASVTVTSPVQNVTPVLTNITVTPATANILIGGTQVFTAAANDQNSDPISVVISWSSSNETVGTIDASGNFSALAAGTTTIKAENGTVNGTASVTVTTTVQTPVLTNITVTPATANLLVGGTQVFTAAANDQNGDPMSVVISWSSSNETVGTIDASGNFSALAAGTTTIKAENGTVNGTASVTVTTAVQTPVLTTIKVVPPTAKIIVGKNRSFMAKTFDQFNNKISALVTWASSNTSVGTIDNNGKFTALSAGKTTITATNGTINGSATITVKAKSFEHVDDDSKEDIEDTEDREDIYDQQNIEEELDEDQV